MTETTAGTPRTAPRALLLSGGGRYADPWHPFPETTPRVAELLGEAGLDVEIADDVDTRLAALVDAAHLPDLLVVNVGLPRDGGTSPGTGGAGLGLASYLRSGRPLLALHVSSTSFAELPEWESALGGRWVRGTTMHPDYGPARVLVRGGERGGERGAAHPISAGLPDFTLDDERYSYLRVDPAVTVLAEQEHDGLLHPIVWAKETDAAHGRAVYDALGHDGASYDSPEHRALLRNAISWLLAA